MGNLASFLIGLVLGLVVCMLIDVLPSPRSSIYTQIRNKSIYSIDDVSNFKNGDTVYVDYGYLLQPVIITHNDTDKDIITFKRQIIESDAFIEEHARYSRFLLNHE